MTIRPHSIAFSLAIAASACARGGDAVADSARARSPGEAAREIAVAVDRAVPTLERREWKTTLADTAVALTAFRDNGATRLIREHLSVGGSALRSARYYFESGKLRYYESEGETAVADSAGKLTGRRKEKSVMAFDILGTLVDGSRQLGDDRSDIDEKAVQAVIARSQALQQQEAQAPPAATKP